MRIFRVFRLSVRFLGILPQLWLWFVLLQFLEPEHKVDEFYMWYKENILRFPARRAAFFVFHLFTIFTAFYIVTNL